MKKILSIYSEDMHDYYLLAVLGIFLESKKYNQINIISFRSKFNRIKNNLEHIQNDKIKINEFNLKSPSTKVLGRLSRLRLKKLVTVPSRLINTITLIYWLLVLNNRKNDFFVTEMQDRINPIIFNMLMPKNNDDKVKYLTLHNIDRFLLQKTQLNNLFKNFKTIVVLSEKLKHKIQSNYKHKNVIVLPAAIPSKETLNSRKKFLEKNNYKIISFCVTGSVDDKRKDYKAIIDLFTNIDRNTYELIFLGKLISQWVKEEALDKSINALFYDDFVSDNEFTNKVTNSHFLLSINNTENYFNTKISGIMYDAIRYGLPLISNNDSFQHSSLKNILLRNYQHLEEIIVQSQNNYLDFFGKKSFYLSKEVLPENLINTLEFS